MRESVTSRQAIALITITRLSTAISTMPAVNIRPHNQDVWIMVLLSILYTYIMMIPLLYLANKFKDSCMIGYLDVVYGKGLGKILGFFYALYFLGNAINDSTVQSELIVTSILVDTPESLILVAMMLTCIYCVSRGVVTVLRATEIMAPIALAIIIGLLFLGVNNFKYYLLLPILSESKILDINLGAMELSTIFSEIFLLAMLIPYLENKKDINKIFIKSSIYSLGLLSIIIVICQITLGVEYTRYSNFPFLLYVRSIDIFEVVERIDSVAVMAWLITSICRISAFLLITVKAFRKLFNKEKNEKVILPIVGLILSITTLYIINNRSVIITREDIDTIRSVLFIVFVIAIPSITCIVYFIRRKSIEIENKL